MNREDRFRLTCESSLLCYRFSDFHKDAEKALGRPVWTHEFADRDVWLSLAIHAASGGLYRPMVAEDPITSAERIVAAAGPRREP